MENGAYVRQDAIFQAGLYWTLYALRLCENDNAIHINRLEIISEDLLTVNFFSRFSKLRLLVLTIFIVALVPIY